MHVHTHMEWMPTTQPPPVEILIQEIQSESPPPALETFSQTIVMSSQLWSSQFIPLTTVMCGSGKIIGETEFLQLGEKSRVWFLLGLPQIYLVCFLFECLYKGRNDLSKIGQKKTKEEVSWRK